MTFSQWLRSRLAPRPAPARRLACPPLLERLEDRTTPSTVRLTPDNFAGVVNSLSPVGSTLYFQADIGSGNQLWRTNGRPGDVVPVDHGSNPTGLGQAGTWLYFITDNGPDAEGVDTYTLWRNDSAAGPTSPSQALQTFPGEAVIDPAFSEPLQYGPYQLTAVGHDLYFGARSTDGVWELWKTTGADGASPSTAPFLYPGFQAYTSYYSNAPWDLQAAGSELYFAADYAHDGNTDNVLWGSDGTPGGTAPVLDSSGDSFSGSIDDSAAVGSDLYVIHDDNLWRFSGQVATEVQSNVGFGVNGLLSAGSGYYMTAAGDSLYFTTTTDPGGGENGPYDLWKCSGSTATIIYETPYSDANPLQIVSAGSDVYVTDVAGPGSGLSTYASRVWKTDGTSGETEILKTFSLASGYVGSSLWIPSGLTAAGATVYFIGPDSRLWSSQGSPGLTQSTGISLGPPLDVSTVDGQGMPSSPLAATGSTLYYSVPESGDLWRLNSPPVANPDAYAANQDSTLTVSAAAGVLANDTDPDAADAGYLTASVVSPPAHGSLTLNADGSFSYIPAAGYFGPDSFTYQTSDGIDPSNVATVSLTVQPLQAALGGLAAGGTLTVQTTAPDQAHDLIAAANALDPATTPACTLVVDLGGQTIQDTTINVPPQVTVQFTNGTFIGGSPALIVSSGDVVIRNSRFLNNTNAATILVEGGQLTLRGCDIESSGASPEAIEVTGVGTVDLGTASDPGGNTITINGAGAFANNTTSNPIPDVGDTFMVGGVRLALSSLSGTVFEDFNDDGQVDFGENGIDGVTITLTGTDFLGNAVSLPQPTSDGGAYAFPNLLPGSYYLTETQPAGHTQGIDTIGTAGGSLSATDQFSVALSAGVNGLNYNFGEQPPAGSPIQKGQTAGIGFWNNKNGQALIKALPVVTNTDGSVTSVANWLAATLPNTFGSLAGQSNAQVAALFQRDFVLKGVKLDAQLLATALSVYATSATLDPTQVAANYGFTVSGNGVGTATVSVGSNGAAFGVANNTTLTLMDLLLAADAQAVNGVLYNGNTTKRNEANIVFSAVNEDGDIN